MLSVHLRVGRGLKGGREGAEGLTLPHLSEQENQAKPETGKRRDRQGIGGSPGYDFTGAVSKGRAEKYLHFQPSRRAPRPAVA